MAQEQDLLEAKDDNKYQRILVILDSLDKVNMNSSILSDVSSIWHVYLGVIYVSSHLFHANNLYIDECGQKCGKAKTS